jgi:photosystem II stability/assembly factor-like uncharacterized protein
MDPQDNSVIYAGTREHGLLMSLDSTTSWQQPRNGGLKEGSVSAVEVDPKDVCTVYVAKGQRLYKTDDCARSFDSEAYVETRTKVAITALAVDWYNTSVVWMGLSNGDILKSEDGANTWRTSLSTKAAVTGLMVNNSDSRVVLVGTEGEAFYKTTDAGESWTQIEDSLKDFKKADKVAALTQDATGSVVVAATGYGLLRSRDFGTTWEALQLLSAPGQVAITAVDVDPRNGEDIVYVAGTTYYRSVDGGVTWTTYKLPSTRIPTALMVDPTDASVVYLGVASEEE